MQLCGEAVYHAAVAGREGRAPRGGRRPTFNYVNFKPIHQACLFFFIICDLTQTNLLKKINKKKHFEIQGVRSGIKY